MSDDKGSTDVREVEVTRTIRRTLRNGTVVSETVTEKKSIRADDPTGGFELFDLDTLSQELKEKAKIKRDAEAEKPEADEAEEEEEEAADDGDKEEDDEDDSGNWSKLELESLKRHNELRRKHGAPPMKLSRELCNFAQNWVNRLAREDRMYHSSNSGYGENIFQGYENQPSMNNGVSATDCWYSEVSMHNYGWNQFVYQTGHFTQVVWKKSTELGIAKAVSRSGKCYISANYKPQGNYQGQFIENVRPPCR